jgi:hypothetical protein
MKNRPITSNDISSFEENWGVALPFEYKEFLLAGNQELFRNKCFNFLGGQKTDSSVIQDFFVLHGEVYRRLDFYMKDRLSRFMLDCIPIANDVFGNLVLLKSGGGGVYFWDHEREGGDDALTPVAQNLDDFLNSLKDIQSGEA